ncbi:MAG: DUF1127 domain-containing protein [Amphritea sp.]
MNDTTLCARNINPHKACDAVPKLHLRDLWQRWRRNSLTRQQLAAMNSHLLKDIGLSRAEALQEISKPFWKD